MTFVSYAQNFEDVMLWRALQHVDNGFYIDIGAQDPVVDSVSLAFRGHGWQGVSVEPCRQYADALRRARPDEFVEQVAIGRQGGKLQFFEFPDTGLSTADADIAQQHEQAGFHCVRTEVPFMTLGELLEKYGGREIHWLKIDVEGLEKSVLESWEEAVVRPWILVVESTRPLTQEVSYDQWEPLVLARDYAFAYFDGLNRFYVHRDHAKLIGKFAAPPNVFDDFGLSGLASHAFYRLVTDKAKDTESALRRQLEDARTRVSAAEKRVDELVRRAEAAENHAHQLARRADVAESRAAELAQAAGEVKARAEESEQRAEQAESRAQESEARQRDLQTQVDQLNGHAHHWWQQASQLEAERNALLHSWSWRITVPLRLGLGLTARPATTLRKVANQTLHRTIEIGQRPLARVMSAVLRRPQLSYRINQFLMRYPALYQQLLKVARQQRVVPGMTVHQPGRSAHSPQAVETELAHLSPRARQIYADLKTTIEKQKGQR